MVQVYKSGIKSGFTWGYPFHFVRYSIELVFGIPMVKLRVSMGGSSTPSNIYKLQTNTDMVANQWRHKGI